MALEYRHIVQQIFVVVLIGQTLACENAFHFWDHARGAGIQSVRV